MYTYTATRYGQSPNGLVFRIQIYSHDSEDHVDGFVIHVNWEDIEDFLFVIDTLRTEEKFRGKDIMEYVEVEKNTNHSLLP